MFKEELSGYKCSRCRASGLDGRSAYLYRGATYCRHCVPLTGWARSVGPSTSKTSYNGLKNLNYTPSANIKVEQNVNLANSKFKMIKKNVV